MVTDDLGKCDHVLDINDGRDAGVVEIVVVQIKELIAVHQALELVGNDGRKELPELTVSGDGLGETADPRVAKVDVTAVVSRQQKARRQPRRRLLR
jgi:hypothetical protein